MVASKIGRKKTILAGIIMLATAFLIGNFITPETPEFIMYPVFILAGIGWATINVNSFPMVVELAKGGDVGKYTGFYYTASMTAQIVTPIFSGFLVQILGWWIFFPYAALFAGCAFVTMFFVKHGDAKPEAQGALEALAGGDD
jgi:MFS family permease